MFDEISYRYKSLSVVVRLLICLLVGALPGGYNYFNVIEDIQTELDTATNQEFASRKKLSDSKEKIKSLPALEEKLAFTRDQLKKAEQRLPNEVLVDEVIKQIGKTGNKTNVELKSFTPAGYEVIKGEYSYDEVRFEVIMRGKFSDLAQWLDEMSSPESRAYPKAWKLNKSIASRVEVPANAYKVQGVASNDVAKMFVDALQAAANAKQNQLVQAQTDRENFKLDMLVDLSYYRVASVEPIPIESQKKTDPNAHPEKKSDENHATPQSGVEKKESHAKNTPEGGSHGL